MDDSKHYTALVSRARTRALTEYYETHHILPRCAGGDDSPANLVRLTPEEHYTAHLLLVQIYKNKSQQVYQKLLYACNLMSGSSNIGRKNKYYGWVRRRLNETRTGTTHSKATKEKISQKVASYFKTNSSWLKGKPLTKEHKAKCSAALKGRTPTAEHKAKISAALKGKPKSPQHRAKFSGENNPAYKAVSSAMVADILAMYRNGEKISSICAYSELSEPKIISVLVENNINPSVRSCPHCGKTGQTSNMLRWHFSNCKTLVY